MTVAGTDVDVTDFNPRSRKGSDARTPPQPAGPSIFQSTLP